MIFTDDPRTQHQKKPLRSTKRPCPRCKTMVNWQNSPSKPFCSDRCKLIDLGDWANESHSISSSAPLNDFNNEF